MKPAIIVDLDGTLFDCRHRLHHLPHDWDAFESNCHLDPVNRAVHECVVAMDKGGYAIIACSGRQEKYRAKTEEALETCDFILADLHMRATGDMRADYIIKKEMLSRIQQDGYDVEFVLDDRPSVVKMWRDEGLACFQVNSHWDEKSKRVREPTLTLMVGPSGAGKSSYIDAMIDGGSWEVTDVVGSDNLREVLTGSQKDQTKNKEVFEALHALVATRLEHGLDTIVDATNIKRKDRLACVALAKGGPVTYIVIDRPLEDKRKTGGWRNELDIDLIGRHHSVFQSNLKDILAGDNQPNVTVVDERTTK